MGNVKKIYPNDAFRSRLKLPSRISYKNIIFYHVVRCFYFFGVWARQMFIKNLVNPMNDAVVK